MKYVVGCNNFRLCYIQNDLLQHKMLCLRQVFLRCFRELIQVHSIENRVPRIRENHHWVCCDRKSRAACAQSFTPRQQATIEIMLATSLCIRLLLRSIVHMLISPELPRRNLSYYCLLALHIMVLFFTHIPFMVNHTINATPPERLQQHPLLFTTNRTDRTFFV